MHVERLNRLIEIMERVEREHKQFHMGAWVYPGEDADDNFKLNPCGTACCALGWAALDPRSVADGLMLQFTHYRPNAEDISFFVTDHESWMRAQTLSIEHGIDIAPHFNGHDGFDAGCAYYDINMAQSNHLFCAACYYGSSALIQPLDVVEHVKQVLAGYLADVPDDNDDDFSDPPATLDDDQATPTDGFV